MRAFFRNMGFQTLLAAMLAAILPTGLIACGPAMAGKMKATSQKFDRNGDPQSFRLFVKSANPKENPDWASEHEFDCSPGKGDDDVCKHLPPLPEDCIVRAEALDGYPLTPSGEWDVTKTGGKCEDFNSFHFFDNRGKQSVAIPPLKNGKVVISVTAQGRDGKTAVDGARIEVDGIEVCKTPCLALEVSPGATVKLSDPRYEESAFAGNPFTNGWRLIMPAYPKGSAASNNYSAANTTNTTPVTTPGGRCLTQIGSANCLVEGFKIDASVFKTQESVGGIAFSMQGDPLEAGSPNLTPKVVGRIPVLAFKPTGVGVQDVAIKVNGTTINGTVEVPAN